MAEVTIGHTTHTINLSNTVSGHWCINIQPSYPHESIKVMFSCKLMNQKEKVATAKKLHRQFCHPTYEFLEKVLGTLDEMDEEFLEILKRYTANCDVCKRYKPTIPKPAVGNLMDPDKMKLNELVSLDLKDKNGKYILYIIDVVTRYTRACFVASKKKDVIIDKFIIMWISIFGAPKALLMDNVGEFANNEMRELGNRYGIY